MTAVVVGIDPGVTGAVGAVSLTGEYVSVADLVPVRHRSIAWADALDLVEHLRLLRADGRIVSVLVEQPAILRGQGAALTIGATFGSIVSAVQIAGAPLQIVTAGSWKAAMGLNRDKGASLDRARLLFPTAPLDRKRDHNRAEALCLAWHGARRLQGASERGCAATWEVDR